MMGLILELDMDKCCSCSACVIACIDQNDTDVASGERPFRTVFRLEQGGRERFAFFSIACMHCANAPCVMACPSGCIAKDPDTGLTVYDNADCIGCHSCSLACPFGAPAFSEDGRMQKCDGCAVRLRYGLEPACVRVCPYGALMVLDTEKDSKPGASLHDLTEPLVDRQR